MKPVLMIGCGNMGQPVLTGMLACGELEPSDVHVVVRSESRQKELLAQWPGIQVATEQGYSGGIWDDLQAKCLIYAAKPQQIAEGILTPYQIHGRLAEEVLLLSLAAGTPTSVFAEAFHTPHVVRVMPNTPAQIGAGISALYANDETRASYGAQVELLLARTGQVLWVEPEALMHVVTAVSGSGPAYAFHLFECLQALFPASPLPAVLEAVEAAVSMHALEWLIAQDGQGRLADLLESSRAEAGNSLDDFCAGVVPLFRDAWTQAAQEVAVPRVSGGDTVRLSPEQAELLVSHTLLGALTLAKQSGLEPAELRTRVTSKGGTTAAGLKVLMETGCESGGMNGLLLRVIEAATYRSRELSGELESV